MIALWFGLAAAAPPPAYPPASTAMQEAVEAELARALTLQLPGATAPYLVAYDCLDGNVRSALGEDGQLVRGDDERFRNVRAEVRVGNYTFDSSNYGGFGEPDGVESRRLPPEDNPTALRRELWLATDSAYKHAVETLSRKAASRKGQKDVPGADYEARPAAVIPPAAETARAWTQDEVEALVRRLSAAASVGGVEAAQAEVRDWHGWRLLVNSEGSRAWSATGNVVVRVEANVRRADGSEVRDARWWVGRDADSVPRPEAMEAEVRAMAARLLEAAAAPDPEPWLGPVIFEGAAAAELFSQLLAPEFVGTRPMEDDGEAGAPPTARLGRRLLPDGWSAWDDPSTHTGAGGEYTIDHEGVAPRRVDLVLGGVLKDILMSRIPGKDRTTSTGHGRGLGMDRRGALPGFVHIKPARLWSTSRLRREALRLAHQVGHDGVLVVQRLTPPAMVQHLDIAFSGEGPLSGLTAPYEACMLRQNGVCEPMRNLRFVGVDRRELREIVGASVGIGPVDMLDGPPGPSRYLIGTTGGVPTTWDVPSVLLGEMELDPALGGEPRALAIERK